MNRFPHRLHATIMYGVPILMALMLTGSLAFAAYAIYLGSQIDTSHGLKPLLEEAWCGKPGCTEGPP